MRVCIMILRCLSPIHTHPRFLLHANLLRNQISIRVPSLLVHAPIVRRITFTDGPARNRFLILALISTMLGIWMMGYRLVTLNVATGQSSIICHSIVFNSPSENLLAIRAPETSKCDLCQVLFCGVGVQGRCEAAPLHAQQPHAMSDLADLVQSSDVYDCFDGLHVEVNYMLDYLTARGKKPLHIYREVRCAASNHVYHFIFRKNSDR
jgi:hypothetical protein